MPAQEKVAWRCLLRSSINLQHEQALLGIDRHAGESYITANRRRKSDHRGGGPNISTEFNPVKAKEFDIV